MTWDIRNGHVIDELREMPEASVHCIVTSPPYWGLRDYGLPPSQWEAVSFSPMPGLPVIDIPEMECCLGLEPDPWSFIGHLVQVFRECRRVLRDDGTLWVNMGDCYVDGGRGADVGSTLGGTRHNQTESRKVKVREASKELKAKNLIGQPWRLAFALQADKWWLRSDIIWHKPNPMPESIKDRPTKSHEYIFLMAKSEKYFYDDEAIKEPAVKAGKVIHSYGFGAKNRRDVSSVNDQRTRTGIANWDQPCPPTRSKRSVWTVTTRGYKDAHFATFPVDLISPCIKAGTSEKGCCPTCGAAQLRILEEVESSEPPVNGWDTEPGSHGREKRRKWDTGDHSQGQRIAERRDEYRSKNYENDCPPTRRTIGFEPACDCGGDPVPCTVLDVFCGSAATGEAAMVAGADFIGIELNPDYCELSRKRLEEADGKLEWLRRQAAEAEFGVPVDPPKTKKVRMAEGQDTLFDLEGA